MVHVLVCRANAANVFGVSGTVTSAGVLADTVSISGIHRRLLCRFCGGDAPVWGDVAVIIPPTIKFLWCNPTVDGLVIVDYWAIHQNK